MSIAFPYRKVKKSMWIAQLLLPAPGTLYFALSGIWNFPCGEEVVCAITALDAFLGVSTMQHKNKSEGDMLNIRKV